MEPQRLYRRLIQYAVTGRREVGLFGQAFRALSVLSRVACFSPLPSLPESTSFARKRLAIPRHPYYRRRNLAFNTRAPPRSIDPPLPRLNHKDMELVQLHAIEEVEGAKGKLTGGLVKVDYATGKVCMPPPDKRSDGISGCVAYSCERMCAAYCSLPVIRQERSTYVPSM